MSLNILKSKRKRVNFSRKTCAKQSLVVENLGLQLVRSDRSTSNDHSD